MKHSEVSEMNKKIIIIGMSLLMLSGCNSNAAEDIGTDTAADITDIVTEASAEEAAETTTEDTVTETTAETTAAVTEALAEETSAEAVTEATADTTATLTEAAAEETVGALNYWTDEKISEYVANEYNLSSSDMVACFEQNGAALAAFTDDSSVSYVIYFKPDQSADLLFQGSGPMGAAVECFNSDTFAPYQSFENTFYIIDQIAMGEGQPISTWHLTADGNVIDLADTIEFETMFDGLFIGSVEDEKYCKNIIGLREQIPGTIAVGASQVIPVTLDSSSKIVKLEEWLYSADIVHGWETIDYSSEAADIPPSGLTLDEEIPFYDYALDVIGDKAVVDYFIENSETFEEFLEYTSYSAHIGRINGDFDRDGEPEYLIATNYGHSYTNDIAIVDNGKVVYKADKDTSSEFYKVRAGQYFRADPEILTDGVLEDHIKYTFSDNTVNTDNMFVGVRDNQRESINYYYQICYDEAEGYSVKLVRTAGWTTRSFESDDGPVTVREFVEESF